MATDLDSVSFTDVLVHQPLRLARRPERRWECGTGSKPWEYCRLFGRIAGVRKRSLPGAGRQTCRRAHAGCQGSRDPAAGYGRYGQTLVERHQALSFAAIVSRCHHGSKSSHLSRTPCDASATAWNISTRSRLGRGAFRRLHGRPCGMRVYSSSRRLLRVYRLAWPDRSRRAPPGASSSARPGPGSASQYLRRRAAATAGSRL